MGTNNLLARLLLASEEIDIKILSFDITGPEPTAILETSKGVIHIVYDPEKDEWV